MGKHQQISGRCSKWSRMCRALRLLCDLANYEKKKLYMSFINYSKAYDRVPRGKLLELLEVRGCGRIMLRAIQAMYACTKSVLRFATIDATMGAVACYSLFTWTR